MKITDNLTKAEATARGGEPWIDTVRSQVRSLRFGVVQIVVHDARVVQIEKTEKIRFANLGAARHWPTGNPEANEANPADLTAGSPKPEGQTL